MFIKFIFVFIAFYSYLIAGTITLTMTEAPTQLIDGLAISKGGLTFSFTNPARSLDYNSAGPGDITFVQDPSIAGGSSQFSIAFSSPVSSVQFGMAEISGSVGGQLATVDLFNGGAVPFATSSLNASLVDPFAEGLFSFSGGPITSMRIIPNSAVPVVAFDNLTVATVVPEPETVVLTAAGLAFVAWRLTRLRTISA